MSSVLIPKLLLAFWLCIRESGPLYHARTWDFRIRLPRFGRSSALYLLNIGNTDRQSAALLSDWQ